MRTVKRVEELERKCDSQEKMIINLSQIVADQNDKLAAYDKILENIPKYVEGLFNEAANKMNQELSDGINQVLNFTPYGAK